MWDAFDEATGRKTVPDSKTYVEILLEGPPKIRNVFGHPHEDWLVMPVTALDAVYLTVEVINQLWPVTPEVLRFNPRCVRRNHIPEYSAPSLFVHASRAGRDDWVQCPGLGWTF